jgi:OOP family OmpA-OmpF porin
VTCCMQKLSPFKEFELQVGEVSTMRASGVFAIRAFGSILIALIAAVSGAAESPPDSRADGIVLRSPDSGIHAGQSGSDSRSGAPILLALHLFKAKDTDGDGVRDRSDECPDTPVQAVVDPRGCPTDEDRDGVFDGIDQCAETARGATVDAAGCPADSDTDGILDGLDMCPDTDPRALVNADGCPYDSDGDGLFDGIDQCPATPTGAVVDERGCPVDTDGDGVADGLDACPETSLDDEADESGCSWVQRGEIVLPTIRFGVGSAQLAPGSSPALNEVAEILKQNPDVSVEIGGHTDNEGSARLNRKVSLERAEAVKAYLVSQGVAASRMVTKGYGEVHPIATNRYAEGRAENRRIEFKVLPALSDHATPEAATGKGGPEDPPPITPSE